jgi:toxin ParE1/3/4
MLLKIIWSEFAEYQLDEIYDYYKKNVSAVFAKKLVLEIIKEPNKLLEAPEIGQIEEFLRHKDIEYRYLIFKNYKLIYSVDYKFGYIKIADVFDTRQNPVKLKRTK